MVSIWFSLLLLLTASRRAFVVARQAQQVHVSTQHGARHPRGLLDGLVGAVLSPVLGAGGSDCSSAHADSVNIGATLPLGISAGLSGSSANAHSRHGCGASASSSSGDVSSHGGSAASAGGNGYAADGSRTAVQTARANHGSEARGRGESIPRGSGWEGQGETLAVNGSTGQTRPCIASNEPRTGYDLGNSGQFVSGTPVRGETTSVSESSSQAASASVGQGGAVAGEQGKSNSGDGLNGYGDGHVSGTNAANRGQEFRGDGLDQGESSGVIGNVLSASSSASRASSSSGSFVGAHSGVQSSRSDAKSSSHSNSFVTTT